MKKIPLTESEIKEKELKQKKIKALIKQIVLGIFCGAIILLLLLMCFTGWINPSDSAS